MQRVKIVICIFFLMCLNPFAQANSQGIQTYAKLWITGNYIGPVLETHPKIKYYLEPEVRLVHNTYYFDEAYVYGGLGYQLTDRFIPAVGVAPVETESITGKITHENRLWQMFLWDIVKNKQVIVTNRSRLEQRKNTVQPQWAWRLRERFRLRFPLSFWDKHTFDVYDEMFFDFNHPAWINNKKVFAENRFFIGVGFILSKKTLIDVGYINQYQFTHPNLMSNGLYLSMTYRA